MRVLIDTNVILDVLYKREEFFEDSLKIWKLCEVKKIDGYLSALSIQNIVYILRKELNPKITLEVIKNINSIFNITSLNEDIIMQAAELKTDDFEDALQMVTAQKTKSEYIITRNVADFKKSNVQPIKPQDFIEIIKYNLNSTN